MRGARWPPWRATHAQQAALVASACVHVASSCAPVPLRAPFSEITTGATQLRRVGADAAAGMQRADLASRLAGCESACGELRRALAAAALDPANSASTRESLSKWAGIVKAPAAGELPEGAA